MTQSDLHRFIPNSLSMYLGCCHYDGFRISKLFVIVSAGFCFYFISAGYNCQIIIGEVFMKNNGKV